MTILEKAQALVDGDRREDYGGIEESFQAIASGWTIILKKTVHAKDVALMMVWMKMARYMTGGYKEDTLIDTAGYVYCLEKLHATNGSGKETT